MFKCIINRGYGEAGFCDKSSLSNKVGEHSTNNDDPYKNEDHNHN
jgi:hypothetical protein